MSFQRLVDLAMQRGGLSTDDALSSLLPLFREVAAVHADGLVAPLRGIDALLVDEQLRVSFDPALARSPLRDQRAVDRVQRSVSRAFEIVGRAEATYDLGGDESQVRSLDVVPDGEEVRHPAFVPGWETWEHRVGHHDELSDIASLGLLLAALVAGLDLARRDDVEELATNRHNVFALAPSVHPVVGGVIARMIQPDRHERAQDLVSLIERLETYRDQPIDLDLRQIAADRGGDLRRTILATLRDRLFDLSRRNRLIWFRPSAQSLNLTEASVPLLLDARNIRPEQLFTWNPSVAARVLSGSPVPLGSAVRWEDAPYANGVLDTLISQARRDRQEFGQAQLRLVVAFLRWHDLKGERDERITSPLLLLPVELTKKRGVRDSYLLQALTPEAEVNPALRQHLRQLYDLELPPTFDLLRGRIEDLHAELRARIQSTEPAVELRLQDRPRIELVHARALIRLEAFTRRAARGNVTLGRRAYAYSYRRRDYRPLGLQIFLDRVAHRPAPVAALLGDAPQPRMPAMAPAISVKRELYHLDEGERGNPYAWDLDLCALTLANFNYRTMSLVRDYRELLADGRTSASFERLFSLEPRPLPVTRPELPLEDRYLVLPSDASQVAAIAHARDGESLVIQGPPGTGKSQTITNLIADYVARGKRVLFVCQKRAAIDVVHARLRQRGLDELSSLIHDSQADKKAFVQGMRATYEAWLGPTDGGDRPEEARRRLLAAIAAAIAEVEAYEVTLGEPAGPPGGHAPTLRAVLERLIDLRDRRWGEELPPADRRLLPTPDAWWPARPAVDAVTAALAAAGTDPRLATSPLRFLAPSVLEAPRPDAEVASAAPAAAAQVRDLVALLEEARGASAVSAPEPAAMTLATAAGIGELGTWVLPLARRGQASALKRASAAAEALRAESRRQRELTTAAEKARRAAAGWTAPLDPDDAGAALAIAERREASWLRFFDSSWRRVRATVRAGYDFGVRAVPISVAEALRLLVASQAAEAALAAARADARDRWGYEDLVELAGRIEAVRRPDDPAIGAWRDRLAGSEDEDLAAALADALIDVQRVRATINRTLDDVDDVPLGSLAATLEALSEPRWSAALRAAAPALRGLAEHPLVARAVRRLAALPDELEYAVSAAALDDAVATRPAALRFDGDRLAALIARVQALLPALYEADAAVIVDRVRSAFREEVAHAGRSVTGMSAEERERKKRWTTGRRELENEFRKVMRYRSIRDLASGDTGAVVAALRPIWLMSPTSVSDTLPLDQTLFDVVIYDEASQIPVEEAVPAMHRANQVIVVGDRMQLPPTRFFTARTDTTASDGTDGAAGIADEDEVEVGVVLDGDSFLAQSAGRLPSTMLTWHYRSRYESLIGFSNAAFYDGRLATIPDREPQPEGRPEIRIDVGDEGGTDEDEARAGVDALLSRPISLHRLDGAPYDHRTNPGEAGYIARLVRELLRRGTRHTIGIVAFSEAQQTEIERQLETLAGADPEFAARYEAELVREDDDQVVGLFVKNLENVQGDERDVILMSVCYGPDVNGRMAMTFGPINQEGGEKRLNVIFSRARVHMAIVSSLDPAAITNTWNDGANTLRRFLEYAAAVSRGDEAGAARITSGLVEGRSSSGVDRARPAVTRQVAAALRERGLVVEEDVGKSAFRIDLAVRRPEDEEHRVAVLVDHDARVRAQPLPERLVNHPGVLRATGWRVVPVLSKDWHATPGDVIAAIERTVADEQAAHAGDPDAARRVVDEALAAAPPSAPVAPASASRAVATADPAASVPDQHVPVQLEPTDEDLAGRSVCFTGLSACSIRGVRLSREDQERLAARAGLDVRQSVSSRLDLLVLGDPGSSSTKAERAAQLGVRRIAERAFWTMVGVEVDPPATGR